MTQLALIPRSPGEVDSSDAQCTPRDLALALGRFDLDVCSNPRSHILADRSLMLENGDDGLADPWTTAAGRPASVFCNKPYSYPDPWCERLRAHRGSWVALPKYDCTTAWWRNLMAVRPWWATFRFRLPFERPGNSGVANFVSALVWTRDWEPSKELRSMLWAPRRERK